LETKDSVRIQVFWPYLFSDKNGNTLSTKVMEKELPEQVDPDALEEMEAFEEILNKATQGAGLAMLATSIVSSSAAILISFIGFSEILAFLPMINLHYPLRLQYFFRGISGLNFQMYDFAKKLEFLPLADTLQPMGKRFTNAGFEYQSFLLNSVDIVFLYLVTLGNYFFFRLLHRLFSSWTKGKAFTAKKLQLF